MIEIKNLKLNENSPSSEGQNFKFANGVNEILYVDRPVYKFLRMKDIGESSGEIYLNDTKIYPNETSDNSIFVLAIFSQVYCLSICVKSTKEEKRNILKNIQDELSTLRDMPITNDEEIKAKIDTINATISHYNIVYVLIDENNEVNSDHIDFINKSIEKYLDTIPFIFLKEDGVTSIKENPNVVNPKKENLITHENVLDLRIGAPTYEEQIVTENVNKTKKDKFDFKKITKIVSPILKNNIGSLLLYMVEIAFSVFLAILGPYLISTEGSSFSSIIVMILLVFCFFASIFIASLIVEPTKKVIDQKLNYKVLSISMFVFDLFGILIAYIIFIIFKATNFVIKTEEWKNTLIITSIIISVISLAIPFTSKYVNILINKIKKAFKK